MANIKQALNTSGTLTKTLASLANSSGWCTTAVDNSTNLFNSADIRVKIKTGAAGVSANGYVGIYLVRSEDGTTTDYDDNFSGTSASITVLNSTLIGYIWANANATTYSGVFDLAQLGLTLPKKWAIAVVNNTGAALDSTEGNHVIGYTEKYATVV